MTKIALEKVAKELNLQKLLLHVGIGGHGDRSTRRSQTLLGLLTTDRSLF